MPIIKSAKKRMRTSEISRVRNKAVKTNVASMKKKLLEVMAEGDKEKACKSFKEYCSVLDKAVKKGIVKDNTANRNKSRMALHLQKLK